MAGATGATTNLPGLPTARQSKTLVPWYFRTPIVLLTLFCCWPVGLTLMWTGKRFPMGARVGITVLVGLLLLLGAIASVYGTAAERNAAKQQAPSAQLPAEAGN